MGLKSHSHATSKTCICAKGRCPSTFTHHSIHLFRIPPPQPCCCWVCSLKNWIRHLLHKVLPEQGLTQLEARNDWTSASTTQVNGGKVLTLRNLATRRRQWKQTKIFQIFQQCGARTVNHHSSFQLLGKAYICITRMRKLYIDMIWYKYDDMMRAKQCWSDLDQERKSRGLMLFLPSASKGARHQEGLVITERSNANF